MSDEQTKRGEIISMTVTERRNIFPPHRNLQEAKPGKCRTFFLPPAAA